MNRSPKIQVVVVDDNDGTRYATTRVLQSAGFAIVEAACGMEALAQVRASTDLVVLDVNLPDIDGFEVCRRLRQSSATAHIPIVHLSASFMDDKDRVIGLNAGADGYLTHPVEPQVLIATINSLLRARNADKARVAADAKLRAVFDLAPIGIATLDSELKFHDANAAFCELVGVPREQLAGQRRDDLLAQLDGESLHQTRKSTSTRWSGILPLQRPDGQRLEIEWIFAFEPVNEIGILIGADVTERRRLEIEREQLLASERAARSDAQHATHLKDEFLATVSHELRNPLASILGWTEVLVRGGSGGGDQAVRGIQRGARLQQQLIADLLDISAMQAGKVHLERGIVDLREVVNGAIDTVRPSAELAKLILLAQSPDEPVNVWGDALRLQQVLWNLLSNAIKFTAPGGRVEVRLEHHDTGNVITVRDSGKGIHPDFVPHIFERFRQAESITSRRVSGLGLGLAIVKQLVDMHDGTVAVFSAGEGMGTTVTITLASVVTHEASPRRAELAGLKVLLVDDDEDQRSWLTRLLADAGMTVRDVPDALAAIDEVPRFTPDVLISDISMPGMDGYALMRKLRGSGVSPELLPAIALTAFSRQVDCDAAMAAEYQAHIAKPVNSSRLLELISSVMGQARYSALELP